MNKLTKIALMLILYISVLYVWSLPITEMPFGDVDASTHFALSDAMSSRDKAIYQLPYNLNFSYGFANDGKIWYPPQYHLDGSFAQIFGNSRIIPFYIFILITATAIVLTSFLLINELYGFWAAFLSSLLLGFSTRDYMTYLFAQWPQAISYYYIPLILYCFYKYLKLKNQKFLYAMVVLLATQFYFHIQGFLHTAAALGVYFIFLLIKEKKLPFNIKHATISFVIFIILVLPYSFLVMGIIEQTVGTGEQAPITRLLTWYPPADTESYPPDYYSFNKMIGIWILPIFLLGLLILTLKRDRKNLLMLAWFVSFYIMIHLDVIGTGARIPRSLQAESHIFYPIAAIGLISLISLIKLPRYKKQIKAALIILFLIFALNFNVKPAYDSLSTYPDIRKISPAQYEVSEWLNKNTGEEGLIGIIGTSSLPKTKWMRQISQRPAVMLSLYQGDKPEEYILLDFSDIVAVGNQEQFQQLLALETQFENYTKAYDKNNIKVYKVGKN